VEKLLDQREPGEAHGRHRLAARLAVARHLLRLDPGQVHDEVAERGRGEVRDAFALRLRSTHVAAVDLDRAARRHRHVVGGVEEARRAAGSSRARRPDPHTDRDRRRLHPREERVERSVRHD
jgi:hypothetical protein